MTLRNGVKFKCLGGKKHGNVVADNMEKAYELRPPDVRQFILNPNCIILHSKASLSYH